MNMSPNAVAELERSLPDYITKQRWYRAKARTIARVQVEDAVAVETADTQVVIVRVDYADGEHDVYLLPLTRSETGEAVANTGWYGALQDAIFRETLLNSIACGARFTGMKGEFIATKGDSFDRRCGGTEQLPSSLSRAEQSNSSIIYGDRYILKVFRKLETGVNPDLEIGRFLTARGFRSTPSVLGELQYRSEKGEAMYAGILQAFVPNQGDAWKYTTEMLAKFFGNVNGEAPPLPSQHPLELSREEVTPAARQAVGEYLEAARLLGVRTAEMHKSLANAQGDADFEPEPFTPEYANVLYREMLHEADRAFSLLRNSGGPEAQELLRREQDVRSRFEQLRTKPVTALRIRHHGDYHLGQVLYTGDDFTIIDFEGEPARPLSERRMKTIAMRDVAGMIRSFSYAAYAALPAGGMESWASFWAAWVSAEYLKGYFETAGAASFVSTNPEERRLLFDAFVLQKALYEVAYELNNRPDWVHIPLRGILNLLR